MDLKSHLTLPILAAALLVVAAPAAADDSLPGARTHTDPSAQLDALPAASETLKLTLLKSVTTAKHVKRGVLVLQARCNLDCEVNVVATAKVSGKLREIGTATKTLAANKTGTIKVKIRSDLRQQIAQGLKFKFVGTPTALL